MRRVFALPHVLPLSELIPDVLLSARRAIDAKTKPLGALGRLEGLAVQLARIQGRLDPALVSPRVVVFAADHGVALEGVSAYPQVVTAQMVANFVSGGAAVTVLARALGAQVTVVDAGIAVRPPEHVLLASRRIGPGTSSFLRGAAMTREQAESAVIEGLQLGFDQPEHGALLLGEMGIGNSSSASAIMHALTGIAIEDCVGRGTGLDDAGVARKRAVIGAAFESWKQVRGESGVDPLDILARFGGFEIAMMAGAALAAASRRNVVVVDGFISTAAIALATRWAPGLLDYCVFSHVSAEAPHRGWLEALGVRALLDLELRLGEGSGAVLALPLLHAACAILRDMATFESAGVSGPAELVR